jgi:catalase
VPKDIILRQCLHFYRVDPAYGSGVAFRMGVEIPGSAKAAE